MVFVDDVELYRTVRSILSAVIATTQSRDQCDHVASSTCVPCLLENVDEDRHVVVAELISL